MPETETEQTPEKRTGTQDRRRKPTSMFSRYTLFGRRRKNRRESDGRADYYADKVGRHYWIFFFVILGLSIIDAEFTLYYLRSGKFTEVNPVMRFLIGKGTGPFLGVKYFITALGLILLIVHQHFRFLRPIVILVFVSYAALCLYHCYFLVRMALH